ncbi:molybdopterin molybdenumtransferase MoeA [Mangrovactinospora gilvigrisea]|uniref:Molybdopterin molybdenumtransferase n=1 Tax=Mangrovactinospora gilvigrisea TaxID=1428644 RepID=A0A1J7BDA5_9ACTN|nr:gephyrin-like molybdotransferase Glp [Mangrovactinospora gilvigrisea]OIV36663.1 molybdopterin molybdenumtransferase MoeA [Mangrovactinospora gilvigrisea]
MSERVWSVDEHLADVLAEARPRAAAEVPLEKAQGRVLAEEVTASGDLPPFDNSSMDGYAVRAADVAGAAADAPVALRVAGEVPAGAGGAGLPKVEPGCCARIMTGAPLPPGADAVVPVEWTDGGLGGGEVAAMPAVAGDGLPVRVFRPAAEGAHVRGAGGDVAAGQSVLAAGAVLGAPRLGLLAAVGRGSVRVVPRPRVAVLSTGSELVAPGAAAELEPGRIWDSNSYALAAAAREAGASVVRVGAVPDEPGALRAAVARVAADADVVVTSGGVSVGAYDVVKAAFEGELSFRKVAMQPGKPQGFGRLGAPADALFFGLPGNPVSAYVSFELFVRPVLRKLAGLPEGEWGRPVVRARLASEVGRSPAGRRQFLRARYEAGTVTPVGGAGSHLVAALAQADALVVVEEAATSLAAGTEVDVVLLG